MPEWPVVKIKFGEARELADWQSISSDLQFASECAQELIELEQDKSQAVLGRALFDACLMAYARCFGGGARTKISRDDLKCLSADPLELHDYLIDQRNKLIAHSVNPFEQFSVGVVIDETDSAKPEVKGVANLSHRLIGLKLHDLEAVKRMIQLIMDEIVAPRISEWEGKLLQRAKGEPIEQLLSRPRLSTQAPGPDAAKTKR